LFVETEQGKVTSRSASVTMAAVISDLSARLLCEGQEEEAG